MQNLSKKVRQGDRQPASHIQRDTRSVLLVAHKPSVMTLYPAPTGEWVGGGGVRLWAVHALWGATGPHSLHLVHALRVSGHDGGGTASRHRVVIDEQAVHTLGSLSKGSQGTQEPARARMHTRIARMGMQ